jgi:gamma-glutamyltranspeptidase / glutathione hydrolase
VGSFPGTIRATMRAGVAAGHPATAEVGAEILAEGGTAADAVVAMGLASCVAESVMSGLLAGCHAIVFDGSRVANLDGFAAVPAGSGEMLGVPVPFGDEIVVYEIGAASCAVPGLPAALGELWERLGRLPWKRLVEPALALARAGVPLPEMHHRSLDMLAAVLSLERGEAIFTRDGRVLQPGELLEQPGLVDCLEALADEGAASVYRGSLAEALLGIDGIVLTAEELRDYRATWSDPVVVEYRGRRVATRGGLSGVPALLPRLPALAGLPETERALALVSSLETADEGGEHTTNMVAVDSHGRACVLTHSLGVGAGVWIPGFDVQLNNLLGEADIAFGEPAAGDHLQSRMAPALAFDSEGLELAIGSAGATRLRTALSTVLAGVLDEGLDAEEAVARPRLHPTPALVDAEPGVDEDALTELEARGRTVRRWDRLHHYFGGVGCVGRAGAAGDPRRSGAAIIL